MTNKQKKELAKQLYLSSNLTQAVIAERVGVSKPTISTWVNDGNWKTLKAASKLTRDKVLEQTYEQISKIYELAESENRGVNSKEADTISKLSNLIEKAQKKVTLPLIIQVLMDVEKFSLQVSPKLTKEINDLHSHFINTYVANGSN